MGSLIGHDSTCVVAIEAPVEEAGCLDRMMLCRALPLFPVERPLQLSGWWGEHIVQPPATNHSYGAERPGLHDFPRFDVEIVTSPLSSHLDDTLRPLHSLHEFHALFRCLA